VGAGEKKGETCAVEKGPSCKEKTKALTKKPLLAGGKPAEGKKGKSICRRKKKR